MKKLILLSTMLLMALVASAQVKVAPKLEKGLKKVYVGEVTTSLLGQSEVKITSETVYEVLDATADGYVIDLVTTDVQTSAEKGDLVSRLLTITTEMLKDAHIKFATDKEGKVVKLLNADEVLATLKSVMGKIFDETLAQAPNLPAGLSKEVLMEQVSGTINEEMLLQSVEMNTSPLVLNGKTIATGAQDYFNNSQGMKMKRMYFVNADGSVITSSTLDMNKDELKQLIIAQVEKMAPDQADMIKQNIDAVINSGTLNMEANEKATYTFDKDKWIDSIQSEVSSTAAGQKTTVKATLKLKK